MDMEPLDLASVVLRSAAFVAVLEAAGLVWFAASCRRAAVDGRRSTDALMRTVALIAFALVVTHRGLDAARLAGDWSGILDSQLERMVWKRRPGVSSLACMAGLLAIVSGAGRSRSWGYPLSLAGGLVVVGSFALTGHTTQALHAGWIRGLLVLHVGIAAYWIGAVAGLLRLTRTSDTHAVARAAQRFSVTAVWLVPLLLPAGSLMIWGLLPDVAALFTPYGAFLAVKAFGFGALIVLAALNRFRYVPALVAGAPEALARFKRVLALEYGVLSGVLAATATMTSLFSWH